MTEVDRKRAPKPDVDKDTAKGRGEGGWSPHPDAASDTPAPFDPDAYRPNVEAPPVKPVGKDDPNAPATRAPENNNAPIAPQPSRDPPGSGHERSSGGLPEKQPSIKQQQ